VNDLADTVPWEFVGYPDIRRQRDRPYHDTHVVDDVADNLVFQPVARSVADTGRNKRFDVAPDGIGLADNRRFRDRLVGEKGVFHFRGAQYSGQRV
jgi:hypothetical protein